jgi:hypothetical protein
MLCIWAKVWFCTKIQILRQGLAVSTDDAEENLLEKRNRDYVTNLLFANKNTSYKKIIQIVNFRSKTLNIWWNEKI